MFITTHSPYILGTINNLLYAGRISGMVDKKRLNEIIKESRWISFDKLDARFIEQGSARSCLDEEFGAIQNEVIDGASEDINDDFDRMVRLKEEFMTADKEENCGYTP